MSDFTKHYLMAALWLGLDNDELPLDEFYSIEDIAEESIQQAIADCTKFQSDFSTMLKSAYEFYTESGMIEHHDSGSPEACAGHDFYLTRNRHGVGFWDRGMGHLGDTLTEVAHTYGEASLYVGDEGKLHF